MAKVSAAHKKRQRLGKGDDRPLVTAPYLAKALLLKELGHMRNTTRMTRMLRCTRVMVYDFGYIHIGYKAPREYSSVS
jgi:hypothetical protein